MSPRTGRPTDARKNHDLKVRVDDKLYDRLIRYAEAENMTKAEAMASIAEQERLSIRSRQKQGIEALRGTPGWENYGRPDQQIPENYEEIMKRWLNHEITAVAAMNLSGLKRTTFYKLAKKYKNGELEI